METVGIFPKGQKATNYFTGEAYVEMLSNDVTTFDAMIYNVTFEPESRNYWHVHPGGQILLCTSGEGYYQEKGKPVKLLKAGDVVEIKPNIMHWHGATPNEQFIHLGVTPQAGKNIVIWHGPVSDEEYEGHF
jgi:quercetin dioxygenase-like cupin family protein